MRVVFLSKFSKDLDKIKSNKLKTSVLGIIESLENANELKVNNQSEENEGTQHGL